MHNENHAISLQDNNGRYLLSKNRFVYTIGYRHLFKDFEWAIGHASESFRGLHRWLALSGYEVSYTMVIKKIPNWINSQLLLYGDSDKEWIIKRLGEMPVILEACQDLHIPIFWMKDVIAAIDENKLEFENYLSPLSTDEIKAAWDKPGQYISLINSPKIGYSPKKLRIGRFIQ